MLTREDLPLMSDPKFTKDRADFSGRPWNKDAVDKSRPEALVEIKSSFEFLETSMLADGREWILKTPGPSLADIEGMSSRYHEIISMVHN